MAAIGKRPFVLVAAVAASALLGLGLLLLVGWLYGPRLWSRATPSSTQLTDAKPPEQSAPKPVPINKVPDSQRLPSSPLPPPPVTDLAFVPGYAKTLTSIRVAELWAFPSIQKAWRDLPDDVRNHAEENSKLLEFDLADFDRVTVVTVNELRQEFWTVILTTRPFDKAQREKQLSKDKEMRWKERTDGDLKYQVVSAPPNQPEPTDPKAVFFASDRVIVIGPEPGLRLALEYFRAPKKEGELAHVVSLIEKSTPHILIAAVLNDDDRAEPSQLPANVRWLLSGPPDAKISMLEARFKTKIELKKTLTFPDADKAEKARDRFAQVQKLGQPLIQFGEIIGAPQRPETELMKQLASMKVDLNGVDLVMTGDVDLEKLVPALSKMGDTPVP